MTRILIIDDHDIVREGVKRLASQIPGTEVDEAANADQGLRLFEINRPDLVILDINLSGSSGLELLGRLQSIDPGARVLMFSMHADAVYAHRALKSGATGFVSKSASADELSQAIKCAIAGKRYVESRLANDMALNPIEGDPLSALTNRETEILRLLGEGKSLNEIADTFGVAYKTIANTCTRLKDKLGVDRTADLIRISLERMNQRPTS
jgi:DNA-binding NarL/FixJ family response regulator